jgi:hypothetical protein
LDLDADSIAKKKQRLNWTLRARRRITNRVV